MFLSVAVLRLTVALEVSVFFGAVVRPSVAVVRVTVAFLEVSFFLSTGPSYVSRANISG